MLSKLSTSSTIPPSNYLIFQVFGWIALASIFLGIATDMLFLVGLPFGLLLVYLTIVDFRKVFYLLIFFIPLSTHLEIPGGLALDLPTEPLMVGLMLIYLAHSVRHAHRRDIAFLNHPITLLLLLHFVWTFVATITSSHPMVSFKFFLAKAWYISVFYFLAHRYLKTEKDIKTIFWLFFIALSITIFSVLIRHASYGFSFVDVARSLKPFYSNHVIYASTIALFFPFTWFARKWYPARSLQWWCIVGGIVLFFIAIQLSYRRAAIMVIYLLIPIYFMIRFKLTRIAMMGAAIGALLLVTHLVTDGTYMEYAPNFEKTVSHQDFDSLVEATAKGEDISTMERLYRWVAAGHMIDDKPLLGFGPGSFYFSYRPYTVTSFETYVSDNPEQSGIHNYFMMVLVEQGIFGFLIFLLFTAVILTKGEAIYHQTKDENLKRLVMMALLSLIAINILLVINDMIETDKIGGFYFLNIAFLVNMDIRNKRSNLNKIHKV